MKITDSPGAMLVMPLKGTAAAKDSELSSTFQPVMSTGPAPVLVTSNQSAPTGLLPLDHGATSVMIKWAGGAAVDDRPRRADFVRVARRDEGAVNADGAQLRDDGVVQAGRVVEGRKRRARRRRAEGDARRSTPPPS